MYRFLLTRRWLGILALTLAAAAGMVMLGNWQLSRYHERAAINARIDAAETVPPAPVPQVMADPGNTAGTAGRPPRSGAEWTRATATGRYDPANVIVVRGRTVDSHVGFEVLTPLILDSGAALLVDRGWLPPGPGGPVDPPQVPAVPPGNVTVTGRVRLSESRPDPLRRQDGVLTTRRISVPELAGKLPYPVYGAYLQLDEQNPPIDRAFSSIPIRHENDWQNAGYVVQWWLFAAMALAGFGWLAWREAHGVPPGRPAPGRPAPAAASPAVRSLS